jgi:RNA polymerase sigma factor (sigma-70 family)
MSQDDATRASLLWKLKSGTDSVREVAWEEFHALYAPTIRRFALRMGASAEMADDVTQEVMLGFFSASPRFVYSPDKGRFRGYLKTCVCRALAKLHAANRLATINLDRLDPTSPRIGEIWDELWEQRLLEQAVVEFRGNHPEQINSVFRRSVLDGESPQAIASALEMTVDAVYKARQRAMAEFRRILARIAEDEP